MTDTTVEQLSNEAAQIAAQNTPLKVLAIVVLGILSGIGWVCGRLWFTCASSIAFCGLAVKYGYRKGARVSTEPKRS